MNRILASFCCVLLLAICFSAVADDELTQVHQDFSQDPGWDCVQNRVQASDPPTVKQDFGWSPTDHTGGGTGEIGGMMWQSRTPAYYAMALNHPLSFKEPFSFSCKIAFTPNTGAGAAYLGFFNHELQGWRVWNSMAVRLGGESGGMAAFGADSMNSLWHATGGTEGYLHVPVDGKPHTFSFSYDPNATPGAWPDPNLKKYLSGKRQTTEQIFEKAQKDDPSLTKEQLEKKLVDAHAAGLIQYLQRTGHESVIGRTSWSGYFWFFKEDKGKDKGSMTMQLDGGQPFKFFIRNQDEPVSMDRFGLFNLQMYHQSIGLYLTDLTVNGEKIDLSKDPGWEGKDNRVQFVEQDFQREDYGFSETNWAGKQIGEVGGVFSSAEPVDPITGYYGDDIGKLTLDDPISFSGNVCFVSDSTDAGMQIGFFNAKEMMAEPSPSRNLHTNTSTLGILVEGGASGGKRFSPQVTSSKDTDVVGQGIPFNPIKKVIPFKVDYDPKANNNIGRLTVTLGDATASMNLTAQQRKDGITFDHFGVCNLRCGGKFVEMYFDDLTYSARRPEDYKPVMHEQKVTFVPYPEGGRKF
jgi:hypothetical protein